MAVVDRDAEAPVADPLQVDDVEDVLRIALPHAGGIRRLSHLREGRTTDLLPPEVLFDLLLQSVRHLDARPLEDLDLDELRIDARPADVDAGREALRLEDVAGDGRRGDPQVGNLDAGRREAGDDRALDHPASVRRRSARDHAATAPERRTERRGKPNRGLRGEVDVDEARRAATSEGALRRPLLPDDALVDLRAGLDLLERVDADTRVDARLRSDRDLVADRDSVVDAHVVADVARAADDRAFDDGAAAEVGPGVDDAARHACALPDGHTAREHGVGADRRAVGDTAVHADEGRPDNRLELVDVDLLAHPHVPAQT